VINNQKADKKDFFFSFFICTQQIANKRKYNILLYILSQKKLEEKLVF